MLKFRFDMHRVGVDPLSITLSQLSKIWVSDKSKRKETATSLLTYIHLCSQIDPDAPFAKVDPTEVSQLCKKEIFGQYDHKFTGTFDEEYMENTVLAYQAAFDSPEGSATRVYDNKIHEINRKIRDTKIEVEKSVDRGKVIFTSNFPIISKMMTDMDKIIQARDKVKSLALKEGVKSDMKGDKKMSFLEKRRREMEKGRVPVEQSENGEYDYDEEQEELEL